MSTLNSDELSALMSAIEEGRVQQASPPSGRATVVPYDLTSQDRIIRGQMPTLDAIHERTASLAASGLSGRTRLDLRVTSTPAAMMKFSDVGALLAPPSTIGVLALGGAYGQALVIMDANLADALLSAALGDRRARPPEPGPSGRRDLTALERLVLRRLLGVFCDAMAVAWEGVLPFRPEVARFETDPRLCLIAPPQDVAILTTFEVSGVLQGRLQLAIPHATIEPARRQLSAPPRSGNGVDERFLRQISRELLGVEVRVNALLGRTTVQLERLLRLEAGDVLVLASAETEPVEVLVQGRRKLLGRPETRGGSLCVVIDTDVRDFRAGHELDTAA